MLQSPGFNLYRPITIMMSSRYFSIGVCILILLLWREGSWADSSSRPNVILFIADDLGYGETSIQGSQDIPTPYIDSIARNGVRFTSAYVTSPYCSTSRAGLMTGRIQNRFGYEFNPIGSQNEEPGLGLPGSETTIAEILQRAGYATGLIGKWHLGGSAPFHPNRRGFDYFYGFTHEGHFFVPPPYDGVVTMLRRHALPDGKKGRWMSKNGKLILSTHMGYSEPDYDANNPIVRQSQPVNETRYLTDAFAEEAVEFIKGHSERPFFLTVAWSAVHSPLQGSDPYMKRFSKIQDKHRRIFAAMLANMDDAVGSILKELKMSGIEDNTIVIFLSDNGGPTKELTSSNLPLRGGKGTMFEGGIRVPFFLSWPGKIEPNQSSDSIISSLDIFPSILEAVDGAPIPRKSLDGKSWWSEDKDGQFILTSHSNRQLFWKLGERRALRVDQWKIVKHPKSDWSLYRVNSDLSESQDLKSEFPTQFNKMIHAWDALNSDMSPPFWKK